MDFDPIILRYEGLDAAEHRIDLAQVGASIQGAAQLLGSAGTVAITGHYAKRSPALAVRILAGTPGPGCWEIPVIILTMLPTGPAIFPAIADFTKKAATKAVTQIVNYVVTSLSSNQPSEAKSAMDLAEKALAEVGQTSRHAIDAVARIAANQRPSVRLLVAPVGESCTRMRVGSPDYGAVSIDKPMRDAIEAPEPIEIGPSGNFDVLLSELDLKNKSCKFTLRNEDDPEHRISGEITDPILLTPNNPYSAALASQRWIGVIGKPVLKEGEVEKLYISDVSRRELSAPHQE